MSSSSRDLQVSAIPSPVEPTQETKLANIDEKLVNPLAGYSVSDLQDMGAAYAREKGLGEFEDDFRKGAMLAQAPLAFEKMPLLTEEDKSVLRRELTHKWNHPATLYHMVIMCSIAAAVQGMDESVINGGELYHYSLSSDILKI
jgi:hypothetical protein